MTGSQLKINRDRLNETLQGTCSQWGALSTGTGMCRLTLTQEDKEVRDWLVAECKTLGCDVKVDEMGNIFAIRPGLATDRKPIAMGSHMDTQVESFTYEACVNRRLICNSTNAASRWTVCEMSPYSWGYADVSVDMTVYLASKQLLKSSEPSTRTVSKRIAQSPSLTGQTRKVRAFLVP